MNQFITLTQIEIDDDLQVVVFARHIVMIKPAEYGSQLWMGEDWGCLRVKQTPDHILARLNSSQ